MPNIFNRTRAYPRGILDPRHNFQLGFGSGGGGVIPPPPVLSLSLVPNGTNSVSWDVSVGTSGGFVYIGIREATSPELTKAEIKNGGGNAVAIDQLADPVNGSPSEGDVFGLNSGVEYVADGYQEYANLSETAVFTSNAVTTSGSVEVDPPTASSIDAGPQVDLAFSLTAVGLDKAAPDDRYILTSTSQSTITSQQIYDGSDQNDQTPLGEGILDFDPAGTLTHQIPIPAGYTGDLYVNTVLVDASTNIGVPMETGPVAVDTSNPVFDVQPTLDGAEYYAGDVVTRTLGSSTGATVTPQTFTLNGSDIESETVGDTWDSTGSGRGTIEFLTVATDDISGVETTSSPVVASLYELPAAAVAPLTTPVSASSIRYVLHKPSDTGGGVITGYDARWSTDEVTWTEQFNISEPAFLNGLLGNTGYYVQTAAKVAGGRGAWSPSGFATTFVSSDPPVANNVSVGPQSGNDLPITLTGLDKDAPDNYLVLTTTAQPGLTTAQVIPGTDAGDQPATDTAAFSVTEANPSTTAPLSDQLNGTYYVNIVLGSAQQEYSAQPEEYGPITLNTGVTVPVVSSVVGAATGQTTATWGATTDTAGGTLFAAARLATDPVLTLTEIENGTGNAVATSQDASPTADANNGGSFTGLTADTEYVFDVFQRTTSESGVASTATPITTDPAAPTGVVELLAEGTGSPVGAQIETAEFTTDGVSHVVLFFLTTAAVTNGEITVNANCTIGAQGRAYGTGTPLIQNNRAFRGRNNNHMFQFGVIPAGTWTFQFETSSGTPRAASVHVLSVPGGGVQTYNRDSNLVSSPTTSNGVTLTTEAANSWVIGCIQAAASSNQVFNFAGTVDGVGANVYTGAGGNAYNHNSQACWTAGPSTPGDVTTSATFTTGANTTLWSVEIKP